MRFADGYEDDLRFRVSDEDLARLDEHAAAADLTRSKITRLALDHYQDNLRRLRAQARRGVDAEDAAPLPTVVPVRFRRAELDEIDRLAQAAALPVAAFMRFVLRRYLDQVNSGRSPPPSPD